MEVNGRTLAARTTGVQRYTREVLSRLTGATGAGATAGPLGTDGHEATGAAPRVLTPDTPRLGVRGHLWEQLTLPRVRTGPDDGGELLWSPGNTGPVRVANQVVTVHDAAVFDHPEWFSRAFVAAYRLIVPRLLRRVRQVITVSSFSADRLMALFDLPADRITVIHNGVAAADPAAARADGATSSPDDSASTAVPPGGPLPERYCLYLGSIEPRKNLAQLVAAWPRVAREHPDVSLVIAGGAGRVFRGDGLSGGGAGAAADLERVHFLGYIADEMLPALLGGAELFVFPSWYEGFGLPPLEAMAAGTAVVAADIPVLHEACGEAAWYADPADPAALATRMSAALAPAAAAERADRIAAGRRRAASFSWDRSAALHRELFATLERN